MAQLGILNGLIVHKSRLRKSPENTTSSISLNPYLNKIRDLERTVLTTNDYNRTLQDQEQFSLTKTINNPPSTLRPSLRNINNINNRRHNGHNDNNDDDANSNWHWQHYHKPYGPKLDKLPLFNDYDYLDDGQNVNGVLWTNLQSNSNHGPAALPSSSASSLASAAQLETKILFNFTSPIAENLLKMMQLKLEKLLLLHNDNRQHLIHNPLPLIQPISTTNLWQNPYLTITPIEKPEPIIETGYKYKLKLMTNGTTNWDHLAQLSCDSGEMIVRLNFTEPFKGIVYPDHNRLSPCRFFGDGHHNYELRLPLRGCGTRQLAPRVFINDIVVRFHKSLELEEDEVKTLICRYPAPQAPSGGHFNLNSPFDQNQPDQFEFIEAGPASPQNKKNSQTQIDTLSENLIVATPPLIGPNPNQTQANIDFLNNNYSNRLPNNNNNGLVDWQIINNIKNDNNSIQNQKNLPLLDSASTITPNGKIINSRPPNGGLTNNLQQRLPVNSNGPLELLLLISSLMFLVLLAMAFVTSYYCLAKRRRRLLSSRTALASASNAHMTSSGGNQNSHYMQTGAPSTSSSSLAGAHYGPPLKQQQSRGYGAQNPALNSFWTPNNSQRGVDRLQGYHNQHLAMETNGIKSATGHGHLGRWSNESQIVDAHLRGQSQFLPTGAHPVVPQRPPRHMLSGPIDQPVQYALVESRQMRKSSEQQASRHHFMGDTSSPSDNEIDLGPYKRLRPNAGSDLNLSHPNQQLWRSGSYISPSRYDQQSTGNQFHSGANQASNVFQQTNLRNSMSKQAENSKRSQKEPELFEYWHHRHQLHDHQNYKHQLSKVSFVGSKKHQGHKRNNNRFSDDEHSSGLESTSDNLMSSHPALNRNGTSPPRPRLIVKSIEDSYIKKYTEIERKEYMERDSRQSLSLADWRALTNSAAQTNAKRSEAAIRYDSKPDVSDDDDSWLDSRGITESAGSVGNLANQMRSLSEVDISFVRPAGTINKDEEPNNVNLLDTSVDNRYDVTPDLIISPEYKVDEDPYNRVRQLQLRLNDNGKQQSTGKNTQQQSSARPETPANSVSYV